MAAQPERIAIIGGGFSGIMTAVNLALQSRKPLHPTLVNHARPTGRGVAYGTSELEVMIEYLI